MDRRGGCCIARYANNGCYGMSSKMGRIMHRFRPIAPKPATKGAFSGGSMVESSEKVSSKAGRGERRYNKENKSSTKKTNTDSNKKRKLSSVETELTRTSSVSDSVVTLSLLPETPERKESLPKEKSQSPIWLSFSNDNFEPVDGGHVSVPLEQTAVLFKAVTSVVTVECVTDTWQDANVLGCDDQERMVNLAKDTCPGFVADGLNQVRWSNKAYGEMVGSEEVIVRLVMNGRAPIMCNAFSCRVRVQSMCRKGKGVMTCPCDVWRMEGGGFAWRLDVEASLSLGR